MSNFNLEYPCGTIIPMDFTTYPDGTENFLIDAAKVNRLFIETKPREVFINWKFEHHGIDMFRLSLISNFFYNQLEFDLGACFLHLKVNYMPHARADRVFKGYNANPLQAFLDFFENLVFDKLSMTDAHNFKAIEDESYVDVYNLITTKGFLAVPNAVYIAPDKGAKLRVKENLKLIDSPVVRSNTFMMVDKQRDEKSGEVTQQLPTGHEAIVKGKVCFIIDDICDGGRTFIGLAGKLKAAGALSVVLVVSHGVFSQGLEVFKDNIDYIWSENCVGSVSEEDLLQFNQGKTKC